MRRRTTLEPRTHIVLWLWQDARADRTYTREHVITMVAMLKRHTSNINARILVITDEPDHNYGCAAYPLWNDFSHLTNASGASLPSCYRRLKLYDPATQKLLGIKEGERIASIDIDACVCGDLTDLLHTQGLYVGWGLRGSYRDEVFNGSFQMFTAGTLQSIWKDFDPALSPMLAAEAGYKGSDQAWLSYKLSAHSRDCTRVVHPVIASYPLYVRLHGLHVKDTRLLFFHGKHKPWHPHVQRETRWITDYWRT